jgi:CRISPR-associated endonuclease/helicase Cas3
MKNAYCAHRNDETGTTQSVLSHLQGTAELAAGFAAAFGAGMEGRRCGMLHDVGKYSDAFQRRLNGSPESVDHSTAGAAEAARLGDVPAAFCVAGHHAGLPDGGNKYDDDDKPTLWGRLNRAKDGRLEDYGGFREEVEIPAGEVPKQFLRTAESGFFFHAHALFLPCGRGFSGHGALYAKRCGERGNFPRWPSTAESWPRTRRRGLKSPWRAGRKTQRDFARRHAAGVRKPGLFTFTAPTGSGKTISSMSFALAHAEANDLRRVIYVIPYCSIIEQTQAVFESVFGDGQHCRALRGRGIQNRRKQSRRRPGQTLSRRRKLGRAGHTHDDRTVFESLFGNRSSRCRKLHNLAGSVLIFDEAQMLPVPFLRPCVAAISELVKNYGCSAVLCTATQPALESFLTEWEPARADRLSCARGGRNSMSSSAVCATRTPAS